MRTATAVTKLTQGNRIAEEATTAAGVGAARMAVSGNWLAGEVQASALVVKLQIPAA